MRTLVPKNRAATHDTHMPPETSNQTGCMLLFVTFHESQCLAFQIDLHLKPFLFLPVEPMVLLLTRCSPVALLFRFGSATSQHNRCGVISWGPASDCLGSEARTRSCPVHQGKGHWQQRLAASGCQSDVFSFFSAVL